MQHSVIKHKRVRAYACVFISPNFQTAQFQGNILIHLISYMLHVVTLDLEKHYNKTIKLL